jgi:hypothetical protein
MVLKHNRLCLTTVMPFVEPGDEFFIILAVAFGGILLYWIFQVLQSELVQSEGATRTEFAIDQVRTVESGFNEWEITLVNLGPATAENVEIGIREFERSQIPLTDQLQIAKRDQWRAGEEITLNYTVQESETVWIHIDISSYRFEHQFRLRQTALGELIQDESRIG